MTRFSVSVVLLTLAGCSGLLPKPVAPPSLHLLDRAANPVPAAAGAGAAPSESAPTLIVNPPHAAAGFDSKRIVYLRKAHQLEYFAHHEWIDTPARMLAPLMIAAIESSGQFRAVVLTPSAASGEMTLDTEIVRLAQNFSTKPSSVRFTLHGVIVEGATRQVLAWREFDATVTASSDDPEGGVVAANLAVQQVLEQLASFCAATIRK
jgi:cholesterol transport system auxiliary component